MNKKLFFFPQTVQSKMKNIDVLCYLVSFIYAIGGSVYWQSLEGQLSRIYQHEKVTPFDSAIPPLRIYPPDYLHMCTKKHVQGCTVHHGPSQPKEHGCCASVCPAVQVSSSPQLILISEKSELCRPLLFV